MTGPPSARAQNASGAVQPQGSISFLVGVPQGEFRDNVSNPGFGLDVFGGLGFGRSPVVIGLDVGFLIYGRERRSEPFSNTIPDVTVEVETTNNIFQTHFVLRLQPPDGAIRPYADALIGFKYLFTQTRIESERFGDNEAIASSTNFDDFALSYGIGGGLTIELYRPQGEDKEVQSVGLQLGAQYLLGSEADYLRKGSIRREGGAIEFDVERSRTTFLEPYLGVAVQF
jgi:hypothetical protein